MNQIVPLGFFYSDTSSYPSPEGEENASPKSEQIKCNKMYKRDDFKN
ncbi:MAG: hypothetical protein JEZ01_19065 [Labilibaculum sp.]|nr:hypothetical protein [Labilibaculum sp.]MBI9059873.1 hypothetical protein [Labilibaculum sp.]